MVDSLLWKSRSLSCSTNYICLLSAQALMVGIHHSLPKPFPCYRLGEVPSSIIRRELLRKYTATDFPQQIAGEVFEYVQRCNEKTPNPISTKQF